jgi:signal transduction histidine kinase
MLSGWFNSPRRLIASFVLRLLIPAMAVAWLGRQLVAQGRELAAQQLGERREIAADRVIAELERLVSATDRQLTGVPGATVRSGDDAVTVTIDGALMEARPRDVLLYQPVLQLRPDPTTEFSTGEALELQSGPAAAIREYGLVASEASLPSIRAGALVRLARALKKAGRDAEALQAYTELENVSSTYIAGVPADLSARRARAALLQERGRVQELRQAAGSLRTDLLASRWLVDRGTFESYLQQAEAWLGTPADVANYREALSASVDWLFNQHQGEFLPAAGRRSMRFREMDVTILWHSNGKRLHALVAGPRFINREWLEPARAKLDHGAIEIALAVPDTPHATSGFIGPMARRSAGDTGLPWTVTITDVHSGPESAGLASQSRIVSAGVALLVLTMTTGGYLIARTIGRELAVARLQSDFVAAVSHEFRTPLTTLRQFTALLLEDDALGAPKRQSFYRAQARATDRLTSLVESLLDFGRMEAGAHPYRMEQVSVDRLVSETVDEFRRDPAVGDFFVRYAIEPAGAVVTGDRDALGRAIRNLLENAVKYSDPPRRVDVEVTREGASIALSVRDQGFGIAGDEQREIFKKFVRGATSRQRGIKGTGIGLAMVHHIVAAHEGRVTVESAIGRGSTFTIWLPVVEAVTSNIVVAEPRPREL